MIYEDDIDVLDLKAKTRRACGATGTDVGNELLKDEAPGT